MSTNTLKMLMSIALFGALWIHGTANAAQKTKSAPAARVEASPAPSTQEIADARAKGMVWVNLGTRVYHKDGDLYGKTRRGKFMTEEDAQKAGFRLAKLPPARKTKEKMDTRDTSGTDSTEATHRSPVPAKPPKP